MTEGNYDTVEGIINRCRNLGAEETAEILEDIEERVNLREDESGYYLKSPENPEDWEMMLHLATMFGSALEREYPAEVEGNDR